MRPATGDVMLSGMFDERLRRIGRLAAGAGLCLAAATGCGTVQRVALQGASNLLLGEEATVAFTSDDDPELVGDALPFAIKTSEVLLRQDPTNPDLCLGTARLCVQYAYAFLEQEADFVEEDDVGEARRLRSRASNLYLRGRDYARRVLDERHPGWADRLSTSPEAALAEMGEADVPFLYWTGLGWAGAINTARGDMGRVAELPLVEAMMRRVLDLDPGYDQGGVHQFFLSYEGGRDEMMGGSLQRAREHFERAVAITEGLSAGPYVGFAESVAVRTQDLALFEAMLNKALAVDVEAAPETRLINTMNRRRAAWLLDRRAELFFEYPTEEN